MPELQRILFIYLLVINVATFLTFGIDKWKARNNRWRLREAALLGLPCVCLYRMGRLNYAIGKLLVDIEFFTLPNILAGRQVQRELLQDEVTARNIFEEARRFYADGDYRGRVVAGLNEATATLGGPGAAGRVAEKILAAAKRYGKDGREVGN